MFQEIPSCRTSKRSNKIQGERDRDTNRRTANPPDPLLVVRGKPSPERDRPRNTRQWNRDIEDRLRNVDGFGRGAGLVDGSQRRDRCCVIHVHLAYHGRPAPSSRPLRTD